MSFSFICFHSKVRNIICGYMKGLSKAVQDSGLEFAKALDHISVERDSLKDCRSVADLFVCVEVLRPSQPKGVMSSAVSLPNHTFTGQA